MSEKNPHPVKTRALEQHKTFRKSPANRASDPKRSARHAKGSRLASRGLYRAGFAVTPCGVEEALEYRVESLTSRSILTMNETGQNRIQNLVEALACIFRQESQHKISILL